MDTVESLLVIESSNNTCTHSCELWAADGCPGIARNSPYPRGPAPYRALLSTKSDADIAYVIAVIERAERDGMFSRAADIEI